MVERLELVRQSLLCRESAHPLANVFAERLGDLERLVAASEGVLLQQPCEQLVESVVGRPDGRDRLESVEE